MSFPPAYELLLRLPDSIKRVGEKCNHDNENGQWCVEWEGICYTIQPATQFQKEAWVRSAARQIANPEDFLMWLCHECSNIQEP